MRKGTPTTTKECYNTDNRLVDLMQKVHNLEVEIVRLEKALNAGKMTKEKARETRDTLEILKKSRRSFATPKVRLLDDIVFPSMANVTTFLEYIILSPYLNRAFERDLIALFFAESIKNENKQPIFARFIEACCWSITSAAVSKRGKVKSNVPLSDFRLILMGIMMDNLWKMMPEIGQYKFKNDTFLNNVLYADFGRAVSWMKEFAHEPYGRLQFDRKRRPALF